jgi:hypothetical protein
LGVKHRQGCCCGGSSPNCLNSCVVCDDVYLKNGVVHDDNGEWPVLQPSSFGSPWRTAPIKFTTNQWTDGDCTAKTGDAYYYYEFSCQTGNNVGDSNQNQIVAALKYSYTTCPPKPPLSQWRTWYDGRLGGATAPGSLGAFTSAVANPKIQCDPFEATFRFASDSSGLTPPTSTARLTFDRDAKAKAKCYCRTCSTPVRPAVLPPGDMILTWEIFGESDDRKTGSTVLRRVAYGSVGNLSVRWIGNVPWWTQSSCSNPTAAPDGYNVAMYCDAIDFLRWCKVPSGPRTALTKAEVGDVRFDLWSNSGQLEGRIRVVDAPGRDGICCFPCPIPKADLRLTIIEEYRPVVPPGPPTFQTLTNTTLVYSSSEYEVPVDQITPNIKKKVGHWKATGVKVNSTGPSDRVMYFDCSIPFYDSQSTGTIGYYPFLVGAPSSYWYGLAPPYVYPYGPMGAGVPPGPASAPVCDPFHAEYVNSISGAIPGSAGTRLWHYYFDEIS